MRILQPLSPWRACFAAAIVFVLSRNLLKASHYPYPYQYQYQQQQQQQQHLNDTSVLRVHVLNNAFLGVLGLRNSTGPAGSLIGSDSALVSQSVAKHNLPQPVDNPHPLATASTLPPYSDDTSSAAQNALKTSNVNRRKFIAYESSSWEKSWLNRIGFLTNKRAICPTLTTGEDAEIAHRFFKTMCTSFAPPPHDDWCVIDDTYQPIWFNISSRGLELNFTFDRPIPDDIDLPPPRRFKATATAIDQDIFSKFTFVDELTNETYVEYIEPLVSQLRFPLAKCKPHPYLLVTFRGYLMHQLATERLLQQNFVYYDAGASSWDQGWGGPSLRYFYDMYQRNGLTFQQMHAFEVSTPVETFYQSVPTTGNLKQKIFYKQTAVVSRPQEETPSQPFLPNYIKRNTKPNDYVVFKLDIDSPLVEQGSIDYILNSSDHIVDELYWEHHCRSYLLYTEWGQDRKKERMPLKGSYQLFLNMRQKGIRAHSWI